MKKVYLVEHLHVEWDPVAIYDNKELAEKEADEIEELRNNIYGIIVTNVREFILNETSYVLKDLRRDRQMDNQPEEE